MAAYFTKEMFEDEARFAKVVSTTQGNALLIAGVVIHVSAPCDDIAELLTGALRSGARMEMVHEASGEQANSPTTTN